MIPSRSRRSTSRRSSILKPPKARHPLQNVDFNSSSSESSPIASKQKRRVSFAEKKHVKEFCDSLEQGTVWDNTYEENDLSNSKLPNISTGDEKASESVTNQNIKEASTNSMNPIEKCANVTNQIGSIIMDVVDPVLSVTRAGSLPNIMCQKNYGTQDTYSLNGEPEIAKLKFPTRGTIRYDDNSVTFSVQNKENVNCLQFSKICSDDDPMQTGVNPFLDLSLKDNVNINERSVARNLFNSKDNTNSILVSDKNTLQKIGTCLDISMEMTGVVGMHAQACREILTSNLLSDKTQYFQDNSMDITGELEDMKTSDTEQITCSTQQGEEHKNTMQMYQKEQEYNFQEDIRNIPMEFTTIVSHCNKPLVFQKECILQSRESCSAESDKTQIFQNVSMEMTEAVHIRGKENCTALNYSESEALGNVSMEFTTAIRSIPYDTEENAVKFSETYRADAVALSDWQEQRDKQSTKIQLHEPDDRTMLMQIPMEITEAVPIYPSKINTCSHTEQVKDQVGRQIETQSGLKNTFLSNDLKDEVSLDRRSILKRTNAINEDGTKIFDNESVAFTEIVPASHLVATTTSQLPESKQTNCRNFSSNKITIYDDSVESTKIFHDVQVSFTEAVPSSFIPLPNVEDVQLRRKFVTVHENDEQHASRERKDFHSKRRNFISEKTIVQDLSMEITKAVSSLPPLDSDLKSAKFDTISTEEHTPVEQSYNSIAIQENSGKISKKRQSADNVILTEEISDEVSTKPMPLRNMDDAQLRSKFVTVHQNDEQHTLREREDFHSKRRNFTSENTIVQDLSMEITKAVSSLPPLDSDLKSAKFDTISTEECTPVEQSYMTQEKSENISEKRQNVDNVILTEKGSRETALPVTNICTPSNVINEKSVTQNAAEAGTKYISHEDNGFQSKYTEMSLMACSKENYSTSITFSARHKNLSVESCNSLKCMQPLSQQTDVTNYCNESARMISENDLTSKCEMRTSENFQSDDADSTETAELKLMKTFINDNIEELETIQPPSFVCSDNSTENSLVDALDDSEKNLVECQNNESVMEDRIETDENSKKVVSQFLIDVEKQLSSKCGADIDMDDLKESYKHVIASTHATVTINKKIENFNLSLANADEMSSLSIKDDLEEATFTPNSNDVMDDKRISSPDNAIKQDIGNDKNRVGEDSMFIQDPFRSLIAKIKNQTKRDDCIWDLYYENIERKMLGISFISNSLLIVIYLADNDGDIATQVIKEVKIISRLAEDVDVMISVVHKILVEKFNAMKLTQLFGNCEEVLPMLDYISQEVKLAMDFMFDLKRLDDLYDMEISRDRISFVSYANKMDIVVIVSVDVKPFSDIKPDHITVSCLLGHVKDDDIKKLITNIKRDSKFLRRYMKDVRDYIELMEGSTV